MRAQPFLQALKELIDTGKVTPVIDGTYPLREVPEAIRYLEEGDVRGKVVITVVRPEGGRPEWAPEWDTLLSGK